jgi:predicted phage terminase large subunit-like protein
MVEKVEFGPQPGPQEMFLETEADIAVYGGAAGGGKTFALLLEPLRNVHNKNFGAVVFRRTMPQIKNEGGLWDETMKVYPFMGAKPNSSEMYWRFPDGATVSFSHLEHEKDVLNWQGAQIPLIMFDELTHFTRRQFFYMLSRNRSTSGVRPYVRATTNPDKKSWLRGFIDWWLYPHDHPLHGQADPSKAGVVRYFMVENDSVIWKDRRDDFPNPELVKSFTFIPAKLTDNKILMKADPHYAANLMALPLVDRKKLQDGDWDAEDKPGELFQKKWFNVLPAAPTGLKKVVRYWERAATEPSERNPDPDWTRGLKMGLMENGQLVVLDLVGCRSKPSGVETLIKNTASQDGKSIIIGFEEDPGQAGKMESQYFTKQLMGYRVEILKPTADKITRAKPVSSQAEVGNILVVQGAWNQVFFDELEAFPGGAHDDIVDTLSGAFAVLLDNSVGSFSKQMSTFKSKPKLGQW